MSAVQHARGLFLAASGARRAARALNRVRRMSPMGRQVLLLACSLAGVVAGAALIGRWALGLAVIADSVFGVWYALFRDVPDSVPRPGETTHEAVLARYRAAP